MATHHALRDWLERRIPAGACLSAFASASAAHAAMHSAGVRRKRICCSSAAQNLFMSLGCLALLACGGQTRRDAHRQAPSTSFLSLPFHGFDPRGFRSSRALSVQRGIASFYADRFSGRATANGELYDPRAYTAAHRTLPLGSIVRVVLARSGYWVLVRINDRGPYASSQRIIDLSRQAAHRLSIMQAGLARVRLEVLQLGRGRGHLRASHVSSRASLAAPTDG